MQQRIHHFTGTLSEIYLNKINCHLLKLSINTLADFHAKTGGDKSASNP